MAKYQVKKTQVFLPEDPEKPLSETKQYLLNIFKSTKEQIKNYNKGLSALNKSLRIIKKLLNEVE